MRLSALAVCLCWRNHVLKRGAPDLFPVSLLTSSAMALAPPTFKTTCRADQEKYQIRPFLHCLTSRCYHAKHRGVARKTLRCYCVHMAIESLKKIIQTAGGQTALADLLCAATGLGAFASRTSATGFNSRNPDQMPPADLCRHWSRLRMIWGCLSGPGSAPGFVSDRSTASRLIFPSPAPGFPPRARRFPVCAGFLFSEASITWLAGQ